MRKVVLGVLAFMFVTSAAFPFIEIATASSWALRVTIRSGSHTFYADRCLFGNDATWYMWLLFDPEINLGPGQQTFRTSYYDAGDKLHGDPDYFKMDYEIDGTGKTVEIGPVPPLEPDTWYTLPDPPLEEDAEFMVTKVYESAVGGFWVPVDKFGLLAPYIALASAIVTTAVVIVSVKRRKKK